MEEEKKEIEEAEEIEEIEEPEEPEENSYKLLSNSNPSEWHNIPRPIIDYLTLIKDVISQQITQTNEQKINFSDFQMLMFDEVKKINKEVFLIGSSIAKFQEECNTRIEEVSSTIIGDVAKFRNDLLVDLDYKQKNNDSKIAYLEEQIFHMKKYTSSLPTALFIENKINDACNETKNKVKAEIRDSMLMPEIRGIDRDIKDLNQ